jgi:hypothetical protein
MIENSIRTKESPVLVLMFIWLSRWISVLVVKLRSTPASGVAAGRVVTV